MQLDIFNDSRDIMLQNDVIAALKQRSTQAGRHALAKLATEYPAHAMLAPMAKLLDTLVMPNTPFADHDAAVGVVHEMETAVMPAAHAVFGGKAATTWLAPMWRLLAQRTAHLPFQAAQSKTHAAWLYLQGGEGAKAEAAVADIASWRRIPATLSWMAQARCNQHGLLPAWPLLLELAWIDSTAFDDLSQRLDEPSLPKLLREFDTAMDSDGTPDRAWFPAWLLAALPELATVFRDTQPGGNKLPERTARLVAELLALEKQGRHADLVAQRKRLRDAHAGLYGFYMASR